MNNNSETVLLTGVSGYIGLHCAKMLLDQGYAVRGTVRSQQKADEVTQTLTDASVNTDKLSFAIVNLTSDEGWDAAAADCDFIMHVASPFTIANPKTEQEMIGPAVEGTQRVLSAGHKAGVKRIVLTSSILAIMGSMKTGEFGPENWTDENAANVSTYTKSKTLAERAAWRFMDNLPKESQMELVVVNPGAVFGPALGKNITGQTMSMMDQMLSGKLPMVPKMAVPMVDVRDVATLHVKAMQSAEAKSQRIIAARREPTTFAEIAQTLKNKGYKGPSTRVAPSFLLKITALFDREAKGMLGMLDTHLTANNTVARDLLEWTPIELTQSIVDTAEAVIAAKGR